MENNATLRVHPNDDGTVTVNYCESLGQMLDCLDDNLIAQDKVIDAFKVFCQYDRLKNLYQYVTVLPVGFSGQIDSMTAVYQDDNGVIYKA